MCDSTPVRNWLIGTLVAIVAVAAIVIGAAIANGSWWYTYLSPFGMLVAAGVTAGAILLVGAAQSALTTFCTCAGPACAGPCSNLGSVLTAVKVVLGIQATACLAVALYAWVPLAAQPAQWAIIGSLIAEAALIISALVFFSQLATCQPTSTPPR